MKLLIFGAGKNSEKIMTCLKTEAVVTAFVDNDSTKWGKTLFGKKVIAPDQIRREEFDFIIIAVLNNQGIIDQLLEFGIKLQKIINPFSYDHKKYREWRNIFYIEELIYLEMNQKIEHLSTYIGNLEYELAARMRDGKIKYPKILSWEDAVYEIVVHGKSMSRYGDGEFDLMLDRQNSFQCCDARLKTRLQEVLISTLPNHIIGIPDAYGYFENRTEEFIQCFRNHLKDGTRDKEYKMLDMDKVYYDSFLTRPYKDYVDRSNVSDKFRRLKTIWEGRELTIVEGERTMLGVGNDLFAGAKSCIRILAPCTNAWSKYAELLDAVLKTEKNRLVLIALGATATVLAYDLAKAGYQAVDIGHIDIEYEWYLKGVEQMIPIEGKYTNEVPGGRNTSAFWRDETYEREIIKWIR